MDGSLDGDDLIDKSGIEGVDLPVAIGVGEIVSGLVPLVGPGCVEDSGEAGVESGLGSCDLGCGGRLSGLVGPLVGSALLGLRGSEVGIERDGFLDERDIVLVDDGVAVGVSEDGQKADIGAGRLPGSVVLGLPGVVIVVARIVAAVVSVVAVVVGENECGRGSDSDDNNRSDYGD